MIWFLRNSWSYLGCNSGSGRWRARWRLLTKGPAAYRSFRRAKARDEALHQAAS